MPVIITPGAPVTPAVPVVSSDGVLTATPLLNLGAVLLKVDPASVPTPLPAVTVFRSVAGVQSVVRGMDAVVSPNGLLLGLDAELLLGVPCTWWAVLAGGSGFTSTAVSLTVPRPVSAQWLKHPTQPGLSVRVAIAQQPQWRSTRPQNTLAVVGRRNPIVTSGVRGAATATVTLYAQTIADQDRLEALLDAGGPYLLQADSGQPNRRDRWVKISTDEFDQPGVGPEFRAVPVDLTEVDRPATAGSSVDIPGHRFADLPGTYAALAGRWLDL